MLPSRLANRVTFHFWEVMKYFFFSPLTCCTSIQNCSCHVWLRHHRKSCQGIGQIVWSRFDNQSFSQFSKKPPLYLHLNLWFCIQEKTLGNEQDHEQMISIFYLLATYYFSAEVLACTSISKKIWCTNPTQLHKRVCILQCQSCTVGESEQLGESLWNPQEYVECERGTTHAEGQSFPGRSALSRHGDFL